MNRTASPVAVVTRFMEDVINGGKFALVEELWAKDMAWHGGSLGDRGSAWTGGRIAP